MSANQWYLDGEITFRYLAIATVEELSEMLGVVVFIYALLAYAVEMNYRLVFHPEQRTGETGKPVGDVIQDLRSFFRRRPVILVAFLILGLNLVLVSCAFTRESVPEPTAQDVATYTEGLIDQFVLDDVVVMVLPGRFNIQNIAAREAVASLITLYDEVMVVVLPSRELSIALAGDALPYDRESLSNLLTEQGAIEFIIFDTSAVNVIVGNMESGTQDG